MWFRKIVGDYRLTGSSQGLKIEVLDYHAEPLWLTRDELRRMGLHLMPAQDGEPPEPPTVPGNARP